MNPNKQNLGYVQLFQNGLLNFCCMFNSFRDLSWSTRANSIVVILTPVVLEVSKIQFA